jgi:hypothetical protein
MSDTPHSPHGYWIDPEGGIHALDKSMAHAAWLHDSGRYDGLDAAAAMEAAVFDGWIGVSVSPVGESVGIRIRPGSAEKKAARALGRIFKQDDMWEREVYTDFASWTGRKLYNHLVRTGCSSDIFPDRKTEIRFVETEIEDRLGDLSFLEAVAAAQSEGNDPDFDRIGQLIGDIQDICAKAYAHLEKISPVGEGITDIEDMRRYCREQISIFDGFSEALSSPIGEMPFAFAGAARPGLEVQPDLLADVNRSLSDLEVIEQLRKIDVELSARVTARSIAGIFWNASPELGKAYRIVEQIETGCGRLVSSKLRLLEKAFDAEEATAESIGFAARYYIGHELARTFSVYGRMYTKDLREQLATARAEFAPSARP